ncbi:unnamed protein product, partial [Ascophyllum nodosum]
DKIHFIRQQHREEPGITHGGRLTSAHDRLTSSASSASSRFLSLARVGLYFEA